MNAQTEQGAYDAHLASLTAAKDAWADTSVEERIAVLEDVKTCTSKVAEAWALLAARKKLLPEGSPLAGEEWISGPYAVISACDALLTTLRGMEGRAFLRPLPKRYTATGQLAVGVFPATLWDRLLLSGLRAEVWMQPGISEVNLPANTASAYGRPAEGKVALVLGAGNIASIAPLDCFHKLFGEHQVVLLKMNPVNDYLTEVLEAALRPLIDLDALRIVRGDGAAGAYLTDHPLVEEIHITGAEATHDAIVWGIGDEAARNKRAGTPKNPRRVTSELGAVCPTIVVPGPWSPEDIRFQAAHIATMKLQNSGFNCIACQVLVMPSDWPKSERLLAETKQVISKNDRLPYYPGAEDRMADFAAQGNGEAVSRGQAPPLALMRHAPGYLSDTEVFAPALSVHEIEGEGADYLAAAIRFANEHLHGTLGANILIHPETLRAIGKRRFETLIGELRYGCIGVNAWSGAGFLTAQVPWGAFPGHTLQDVQSGIGMVHNAYMFDKAEKSIIRGPWAPFPRSVFVGERTLLPLPPWFITHRRANKVISRLTAFLVDRRLWRLPGIFLSALRG